MALVYSPSAAVPGECRTLTHNPHDPERRQTLVQVCPNTAEDLLFLVPVQPLQQSHKAGVAILILRMRRPRRRQGDW